MFTFSIQISGLLILLNTFAGPVFFSVSLPLLLFWPQIPNRLLGTGNKNGQQSSKGEFDWIEAPELLRTRMFRLMVMYQMLNGVKVVLYFPFENRFQSLFLSQSWHTCREKNFLAHSRSLS